MAQSIFSTPNQPIIFSPAADENCNCGERMQCQMVVPEQQVYAQLQITPCGEVEVCNNTLGNELVTNGNFDTNLDGWTTGIYTEWSGGAACNNDNGLQLIQTIAINPGSSYLISFTILGYNAGSLLSKLGGDDISGSPFNANGSYSIVAVCGAGSEIQFGANVDFEGCIDNISVKEILTCWDADGTDWATSVFGACHITGNTTALTNTGTTVTSGNYYHVTITVSGGTAGYIDVVLGGATLVAIPPLPAGFMGNGTFEFWGIAGAGTDVVINPSTDFDGCVSGLGIVQYCAPSDAIFHLVDADGNFVSNISNYFSLFEDRWNLTDFSFDKLGIGYGCYKLCLVDCCYGDPRQFSSNLIDNGTFSDGADNWTSDGATFTGTNVILDHTVHSFIEQNLKTESELECMRIRMGFLSEGSGTLVVTVDGVTVYSSFIMGSGSIDVHVDGPIIAGALVHFEVQGGTMDFSFDNVIIDVPAECRVYSQCTGCIKYAAEFDCTKMIEGYCEGNAFNFHFDDATGNNIFKLSQRVKCEFGNPVYNQEQSDYGFSTGVDSINYASSQKFKTLFIEPINEAKHDVIALIKISDHIFVESTEYFSQKGDYQPKWNRNVLVDLAQSELNLKIKAQTLFNGNCG